MLKRTPIVKILGQVNRKCVQMRIEKLPPIGAAKLHDTPTAQAAASISLFLDSFSYIPLKEVTKLDIRVATMLAMCTNGPYNRCSIEFVDTLVGRHAFLPL